MANAPKLFGEQRQGIHFTVESYYHGRELRGGRWRATGNIWNSDEWENAEQWARQTIEPRRAIFAAMMHQHKTFDPYMGYDSV